MLVTSEELLEDAQASGYAVGQFNTSTWEITKAIIQAASKLQSPLILATSEGEANHFEPEYLAEIAKIASQKAGLPIALHLDHGKSLKIALRALNAGYSSIHIDGSELPFSENVALTLSVVEAAHGIGASVEGELGQVAGHSVPHREKTSQAVKEEWLTDPQKAAEFVELTGIDALAVSIGNVHGLYRGKPRLDFNRLKKIRSLVKIPLVLHGGSGIAEEDIKKAISLGICKINVNTELRLAYTQSLRQVLTKNPQEVIPYKIFPKVIEAVEEVVSEKIKLFGSENKG